jgi:DNA adenine methylase
MGGKFTLATHLLPFVLETKPTRIIEPFLGGGNFMVRAFKEGYTGEYIAGDYDKDNSFMWKCVLEGWLPKYEDQPSREEYTEMKNAAFSENPLRGFVRSVGSFGSIPWGGYALGVVYDRNPEENIWKSACNSMKRDSNFVKDKNIAIIGGDYSTYAEYITPDSVVYCDPPYSATTGYTKGETFDHIRFWDTVREWSKTCPVYVSELTAPDDFVSVFDKGKNHGTGGTMSVKKVTEKLFVHKSQLKEQ